MSPLLTLTLFCYGDTLGSFAFTACFITSIYHHLIYIGNSIINSLQQNSKLLKVVLSNPNQLLCNSHAFVYHRLYTFHVGFSFQKQSKTTFIKEENLVATPSFLTLHVFHYTTISYCWMIIATWLPLATLLSPNHACQQIDCIISSLGKWSNTETSITDCRIEDTMCKKTMKCWCGKIFTAIPLEEMPRPTTPFVR